MVYTKKAPVLSTETHTVNEIIHYVYDNGTMAFHDYVATPVSFTREVSTDPVTDEKTYGEWTADQSFAPVDSPEKKGYTPDQTLIGSQTVSGDSKDLVFTVVYTKITDMVTPPTDMVTPPMHKVTPPTDMVTQIDKVELPNTGVQRKDSSRIMGFIILLFLGGFSMLFSRKLNK